MPTPAPSATPAPSSGGSPSRRALVVDDSKAIRMLLGKILRELGWDVAEAGDGREALAVLGASAHMDVALIDWHMPDMDGLELAETIRGDEYWGELPMLMVTSEAAGESVERALAIGVNEYAMKPFNLEVIREKLSLMGFPDGSGTDGERVGDGTDHR